MPEDTTVRELLVTIRALLDYEYPDRIWQDAMAKIQDRWEQVPDAIKESLDHDASCLAWEWSQPAED